MKHILIINGPNLQMLGKREPKIYGSETLKDIETTLQKLAVELKVTLSFFQSNHEGQIVDTICNSINKIDAIIINPAAYTHTSIAIRDAISATSIPTIEIHISNIHAREEFRKKSFIAPVCVGQISGFGTFGYNMALLAINKYLSKK